MGYRKIEGGPIGLFSIRVSYVVVSGLHGSVISGFGFVKAR